VFSIVFSLKSGLQRHIALHTNKKPYNMSVVRSHLVRKYILKGAHESSHCGGTPQMSYCDRAFNSKPSLKNHVRIHHHHGRKLSGCSQCEKPFPAPSALKIHMLRGNTGRNHNKVLFVRRLLLLVTSCKSISKFMAERIL
jgi:hypothetical protein